MKVPVSGLSGFCGRPSWVGLQAGASVKEKGDWTAVVIGDAMAARWRPVGKFVGRTLSQLDSDGSLRATRLFMEE
ncbi:hypothetical protein ACRALDRAFT_2037574 [Sodiomyces alcalophilus JCM 7366]|uniref:uncharacterized protein n=1 Tax=Sodiomyces alcalophilus JCM 7366 TaxID=591952 RepID=UPI0039B4B9F8